MCGFDILAFDFDAFGGVLAMTFAREVRHFRVSYPKGGQSEGTETFFFSLFRSQQPNTSRQSKTTHTNKQNATYE
jgi:hypothetical protein